MATTWQPRTSFEQRSWLLTNGEIAQEPAMEETPSGRKVRIAGTEITAWARDVDELILRAVRMLAEQKQTQVWMPLKNAREAEQGQLGYIPAEAKAQLHFLGKDRSVRSTHLWWRFKHPTLPIEAVLTLEAWDMGYGADRPQRIRINLVHPRTVIDNNRIEALFLKEELGDFGNTIAASTNGMYHRQQALREFIRDNPPSWDAYKILGSAQQFTNERLAVEAILKQVEAIDELASIQILDLRDLDQPVWMDLELYETNVNQQLVSDLKDYLEGTPSVEKAAQLYSELRDTLRSIGVVLGELSANDFLRALNGGGDALLTVHVSPISAEEGGRDDAHSLSVNLATGTFVVNCSTYVDKDAVAHKWEEVKLVEQLSGREDTLLAYAREYARRAQEKRAKQILEDRKNGLIS